MNTHAVYKLAVQAQLAAALRELMRIAHESEYQLLSQIKVSVNEDGSIDVTEVLGSGMEISGYCL